MKKILSTTNYAASYPDNLTSLNKSETTKLTEAEVPQSFEGVIKLAVIFLNCFSIFFRIKNMNFRKKVIGGQHYD